MILNKKHLLKAHLILLITILAHSCVGEKTPDTEKKKKGLEIYNRIDSTANLTERISAAHEAYQFNREIGNDSVIYETQFKLGILHLMIGNMDSSIHFLEKAETGFHNLGLKNREIRTKAALLTGYRHSDNKQEALRQLFETERIILTQDEPSEENIFYYLQKAGFYFSLDMIDSTLVAAQLADSIASQIGSNRFEPQIRNVQGVAFSHIGNDSLAIENYLSVLDQYGPRETDRAIVLTNIANVYARLEQTDSSLLYYKMAKEVYMEIGVNESKLHELNMHIAYTFIDLDTDISKHYFEKVDFEQLKPKNKFYHYYVRAVYAESTKDKISATLETMDYLAGLTIPKKQFESVCHFDLYGYYTELEEHDQALFHYEEYNKITDEIHKEEIKLKLQTAELVHNVKEKDQQIIAQEALLKEKNQLIGAQKTGLALAIIVALLIIIALAIFIQSYRRKGKINQLKLQQNILEQKLLIKEMDPISFQLKSAIETIEETKSRLGKIKSGEPKNQLNEVKIGLQQWLLRHKEKSGTDSALKLIEGNFLEKLNGYPELTKSEKNIIILIKQGYQTKEISDQLNLAQNTIEIYRSRIRKKLNLTKQDHLQDFINNL